jgi:hypothetical protein
LRTRYHCRGRRTKTRRRPSLEANGSSNERGSQALFCDVHTTGRFRTPVAKQGGLIRLVKPDAVDQVGKARVTAEGIKVGMHFDPLQNV